MDRRNCKRTQRSMVTGKATKKSQARVGHEIAKRPVTRAQVIKYQEMLLPIGTMKQEIEFCLRNLKGLACDSKDDKVRLLATVKLLEVCERREQIEREQAKVSAERGASSSGSICAVPQSARATNRGGRSRHWRVSRVFGQSARRIIGSSGNLWVTGWLSAGVELGNDRTSGRWRRKNFARLPSRCG
jgi:hypothetical protein